MSLFRKLLLSFCLFFPLITTQAQYRFDQWTADDGLPQNSVYAVKQTRDGYLWLATLDGLVRFDGVRFTVFNKSNSPGIVNNRFTSLFEAAGGDLWAGTEESGVARYHQGRFTSYGVESGLDSPNVYQISGDAGGNPLIFSSNLQVYRFSDDKFSALNAEIDSPPATPIARPESIPIPCHSDLDKKQSACLVNGQWAKLSPADGLPNLNIISSVQDIDGTLWLLITDAGLAHLENGKVTKIYTKQDGLPEIPVLLVPGARLNLISKDKQGALWLTDLKTMRNELLTRQPPASLTEIHIGYEDREGNVWFGSLRNGLFRVRKQVITAYSKADGLAENNVYPIFEDRRGTVWIGTTKGVFKYENETFTLVKSSENFYIDALGEDASGRLLVSSYGILYVLEGNQFISFYTSRLGVNWAIHTDRENALWVGSQDGLVRSKDNITTTFTTGNGLAGNHIKVIIEDKKNGGLWIGSYGGLTHYKNGKFTRWTETDGLQSRTIRALYEDGDGVLWIGSYDGGLTRFADGKFTHYNMQIGLFNDGAFQILEDARRNFWISSNRGIYRVSKDELNEFAEGRRRSITSVGYGKSDGMLNVEANGGRFPGGIKTRDGRLWFPTQDGVAVINPETIKINPQPPPVIIEDVKIDAQSVAVETINSASRNPQFAIRIEPQQQNFEIKYTALSFINSGNLRFKYKLEGLDSEWIDAANRRTAYFSHVPPGDYTFRVIAANADGIWNESGASVNITILPPFYRTWWFVVLSVLAIGALAYFLFNRRIVQLERERIAQQTFSRQLIASQEAERKRIAAELHDSLGQRLVVIKNLALMFLSAKNRNETSKIEEISAEASQAIGEVKVISYNLRPYQLDRIGLTKAIEAIIRPARAASEIDFTAEIGDIDDYFPKDAEINFYRIVQECVNNIIKHSGATEAFVKIKCSVKTLELEISDDGKGFSLTHPESKTGGFGLIGIAERAELLGGRVEIKSAPGQGTVIRILIKSEQ